MTGTCSKPAFLQRFAQQIDVVAGAAAAAGLGDNQRDLIDVVFAGVQRVEKLADDQQRRHAGVVVHVFEALGHDVWAAVGQQLGVIAVEAEHLDDQRKVELQHVGHEDGVARLPHFAGKFNVIAGHTCFLSISVILSLTSPRVRRAAEGLFLCGQRLLLVDGGEQRTQTDAHRAQIGDFVNLDLRVNLVPRIRESRAPRRW